ncbi:hypothetical protein FJZ36_01315 [Candidatus Poribacteria bacterium]|nr:hypothetical protein [Candidatus Poribacteria bacterium]
MGSWHIVLRDDFASLPLGPLACDYSPLGEYHDIRQRPAIGWRELTLHHSWRRLPRWLVGEEDGVPYLHQSSFLEQGTPMIGVGDPAWRDCRATVAVRRFSREGRAGVCLRTEDPRHWVGAYFEGDHFVLAEVDDEERRELGRAECAFDGDRWISVSLSVTGHAVEVAVGGSPVIRSEGPIQVAAGRMALMATIPARFRAVRVWVPEPELARLDQDETLRCATRRRRASEVPQPIVWRRFETPGFGVGKSVRFGDLDGDGELEMLFAQNVPLSGYDFDGVSCLTAVRLDGRILWQVGTPSDSCGLLTNDVAVQIHDIDGDGREEVIYAKDFQIVVRDGQTGAEKRRVPTPLHGENRTWLKEHVYHRIIGDSLFFCDLEGSGAPRNLVIKDRYNNLWAYDTELEPLWHWSGNTGHYPYALDVDGDGRDEVLIGYSLLSPDGEGLWTLDGVRDHADGVAFAPVGPDGSIRALFACSDEGMIWSDLRGRILRHDRPGHAQCCHVANLDPARTGLEVATITFWGEPGIVVTYDADGNRLARFSPFPMGSHLTPTNWVGDGQEHLLLSAMPQDGGLYDAYGSQIVQLPDDGHPTLCCEPIDLTGDARDEIVVWDTRSVWVYTQDRAFEGTRLYVPQRNAHHNYSNYRSIVSLPAWDDGSG